MFYQIKKKSTPFYTFSVLASSFVVASADSEEDTKTTSTVDNSKIEKVRLDERIKNSDTAIEERSLKVQKLNLVLQESKTKLKLVEIKKDVPKKVENKPAVTIEKQNLRERPAISQVSNAGNLYAHGWCTWGVKQVAPWVGNHWGNAYQWAASAAAEGYEVGKVPTVGSVVVWSGNHVAYVTDVREDGYIQVLEANYNGNRFVANHRGYFNPNGIQGSVSYIYPKA